MTNGYSSFIVRKPLSMKACSHGLSFRDKVEKYIVFNNRQKQIRKANIKKEASIIMRNTLIQADILDFWQL
jgi:hypothetical protein